MVLKVYYQDKRIHKINHLPHRTTPFLISSSPSKPGNVSPPLGGIDGVLSRILKTAVAADDAREASAAKPGSTLTDIAT